MLTQTQFYAFSQHICSNTSISKFHVSLELVDGSTELFDNNGMGYPVQNEVILQTHQSCLSNIIDGNGERNMTIVAAVSHLRCKIPRFISY